MSPDEFRTTVTAPDNRTTVVSVYGDVDIATSPTLRRLLAVVQGCRHRDRPDTHVVIDLSGVTFLDASGLGVLVEASRSADRGGHALVLRHPSPACTRVLEITRLASAFRIDATSSGRRDRKGYEYQLARALVAG